MKTITLLLASILLVIPIFAETQNEGSLEQFLNDGKPLIDLRLRYENVGQTGVFDADALTVRTRLGYQTADFNGLQALVEMEDIRLLSDDDDVNLAASNLPAGAGHAVIPDPEVTELNRVWLSYTYDKNVVKIGRERIKLDNDRFVGNVGWRQNEQSYDMASFKSSHVENLELFYAYVWQVNRVFGSQSANPAFSDFEGDSHLFNLSYTVNDLLKLTGFAYLLELDLNGAKASASGDTFGLAVEGSYEIDNDWKLTYKGSYATQSDNDGNPVAGGRSNFDLDYYQIEAGLKYESAFFNVGFEMLEGDGTNSFNTPLATVHAFQGWSDVFLAPSVSGLGLGGGVEDLYLSAGYKIPIKKGVTIKAIHHWFSTENSSNGYSGDYGTELDLIVIYPINKYFNVLAKYATYRADSSVGNPISADVDKFWFELNFKY